MASLLEGFIIFSRTLIRVSSPRNEESFDLVVFCRATKTRFAFFSFVHCSQNCVLRRNYETM